MIRRASRVPADLLNQKALAPTIILHARVAKPADARDLGSRGETREGSSPSSRMPSLRACAATSPFGLVRSGASSDFRGSGAVGRGSPCCNADPCHPERSEGSALAVRFRARSRSSKLRRRARSFDEKSPNSGTISGRSNTRIQDDPVGPKSLGHPVNAGDLSGP